MKTIDVVLERKARTRKEIFLRGELNRRLGHRWNDPTLEDGRMVLVWSGAWQA